MGVDDPCRDRHLNLFFPFMMTSLDWRTAEVYTRTLHLDPTSRLHLCPLDVIESMCPYLHTHVVEGLPRYDDKLHGRIAYKWSLYRTLYEYMFDQIMLECEWHTDGDMHRYYEYSEGGTVVVIWFDDGRIIIYAKGVYTIHDTLPEEYRYVWELMTRVVIATHRSIFHTHHHNTIIDAALRQHALLVQSRNNRHIPYNGTDSRMAFRIRIIHLSYKNR